MTRISLDLNKTIDQNAAVYFEKAKKLKKKIEGAKEALNKNLKKLEDLKKKRDKAVKIKEEEKVLSERKKEWYEKFRWFVSSEGFLVIGGRDATSNEIVIKKHTDNNDIVFHTDMAGSPFFVIKTEGKKPGEETMKEVADATCSFSRAWKLGLSTSSVFYVNPDQVSKKTKSGEYMNKGSFMIYGKTNYIDNEMNLAIGITKDEKIMSGPLESIKKNCVKHLKLIQGNEKTSSVAKFIKAKLGGSLDEIIRSIPGGGCKVKK